MPTAEGRVQTPRAERYLAQLVDHLTHLGQDSEGHKPGQHGQHGHGAVGAVGSGGHEGPPVVRHVERADGHARIEFDWGRFEVTATATDLSSKSTPTTPAPRRAARHSSRTAWRPSVAVST